VGSAVVEELNAKVADAPLEQFGDDFGGGLGDCVEESVAAAHVGGEGMFHAEAVAQLDLVGVTGATAIRFVRAGRQNRAEDAVLHMEHGHVLVDDDFEPSGWDGGDQVEKLIAVEIVGGSDFGRALLNEVMSREFVGGVEGVIGDNGNVTLAEEA